MKKESFFGKALWLGAAERNFGTFSILYGEFDAKQADTATLNVLGLGFFKCYINGICINPNTFLPLSSEYDVGSQPKDEELSGRRIYVPSFDITPYIISGKNIIAVHFGGGWYCANARKFGLPKAIYQIKVESGDATKFFCSDENCRIGRSYINDYYFVYKESHDYKSISPIFDKIRL